MKVLKHLFENNRLWANNRKESDPDFFNKLLHQQTPEYLWISCSDRKVPANEFARTEAVSRILSKNTE